MSICLQETRQQIKSTPLYNYFNKIRKNKEHGGCISIGIHKQFISRDISHIFPILPQELEILLIESICQQIEVLTLNIYSPKSSIIQKQFLIKLSGNKNKPLIIICGDFNTRSLIFPNFKDMIPEDQFIYKRNINGRIRVSQTVTMQINEQIQAMFFSKFYQESNHSLNTLKIEITKDIKAQFNIIKKNVPLLNLKSKTASSLAEFITHQQHNLHLFQCYKRKRLIKNRSKSTFVYMLNKIEKLLLSDSSNLSHYLINKLNIVHPQKREGGIMNCYIKYDELINNLNLANNNVIEQLGMIQSVSKFSPKTLTNLPPLSIN